MTATNIEDALHKTPFTRFELHLDNGKTVPVNHQDCGLLTPSKKTAVVAEGERLHIMDVDHISALSVANR
jgi:hypothetical protein